LKSSFPYTCLRDIGYITGNSTLLNLDEDIANIRTNSTKLKVAVENFLSTNGDDYVLEFVLTNLKKIDILLNNYDKIIPHHMLDNIDSIALIVPNLLQMIKTKRLQKNVKVFLNLQGVYMVAILNL
jgi:hypothetical protein